MNLGRYWKWVAAGLAVGVAALGRMWPSSAPLAPGTYEVPTLTAWGKIFSLLLLAALGVAYLVWRRPVLQAQAILETSPLGTARPAPPLVDWSLYIKALLVVEAVALAAVWAWSTWKGRLSSMDGLGILASGAIAAFVIHLLILSQRNDGGGSR